MVQNILKMKLFGVLLLCVPILGATQVNINVQLPPSGLVQKDQLWNLVVSNNGSVVPAKISLVLKDPSNGQVVLSANSGTFMLNNGLKIIAVKDIQPIDYNIAAGNFTGNYLPAGSYLACYRVSVSVHEGYKPVAEECIRMQIHPLSPPLLNSPANRSVLKTISPQFTWVPPAPMDMFDNLNYSLNVVEVLNGQSSIDAIQRNVPVYQKNFTKLTYENYPSSFSALEEGKMYAWQVTAINGNSYAQPTEVWTFQIAKDSVIAHTVNGSYILLKNSNEQGGISYLSSDTLFIKYYSFDKEQQSTVRFYNARRKLLQEKKQKIIYGDNFLMFRLNNLYRKGEVYTVEITDSGNSVHSASFTIQ